MVYKLHEFVPSFTLYLNVENAQNPAQKYLKKNTRSSTCLWIILMLSVHKKDAENNVSVLRLHSSVQHLVYVRVSVLKIYI